MRLPERHSKRQECPVNVLSTRLRQPSNDVKCLVLKFLMFPIQFEDLQHVALTGAKTKVGRGPFVGLRAARDSVVCPLDTNQLQQHQGQALCWIRNLCVDPRSTVVRGRLQQKGAYTCTQENGCIVLCPFGPPVSTHKNTDPSNCSWSLSNSCKRD